MQLPVPCGRVQRVQPRELHGLQRHAELQRLSDHQRRRYRTPTIAPTLWAATPNGSFNFTGFGTVTQAGPGRARILPHPADAGSRISSKQSEDAASITGAALAHYNPPASILPLAVRLSAFAPDSTLARRRNSAPDAMRRSLQTYALTGMARSFSQAAIHRRLSAGNPFLHQRSGTWYAMFAARRRDFPAALARRLRRARRRTFRNSHRLCHGLGQPRAPYLHRTARGALIELPLGLVSGKRRHLGHEPRPRPRLLLPPRAIAYECMFCHNAYPKIPAGHEEPGSEPLYSGALPEGIDCQRCHGPGANHIARRNRKAAHDRRSAQPS